VLEPPATGSGGAVGGVAELVGLVLGAAAVVLLVTGLATYRRSRS
jgi:hypothetical protein